MKPYPSLKSILAEFFPLHRTLASDEQASCYGNSV